MDMYTASTHPHAGVLRELSGNVPVILVQGFDVGRGRRKEFRAHESQVVEKVKVAEKAKVPELEIVKTEKGDSSINL